MTRILFIIFLLTGSATFTSEAQTARQDSLETRLQVVEDPDKIPILIDLVKLNQQNQPSTALDYANRAEELLQSFPNAEQESLLYTQIGWIHFYMGEFEKAYDSAKQAELLASAIPYHEGVARSKHLRGRLLRESGEYVQAVSALDSALVSAGKDDIPLLKSAILNEFGTVYRRKGESNEALEYHERALGLIQELDDKEALPITYNYMGINYDILGRYDQALRMHLLSLEVQQELGNHRGIATSMTNIGTVHQKIGQYEEAMEFYQKSLPVWEELGLQNERASTINNMGAVQEILGNYEAARSYYESAYSIWTGLGNVYSSAIALDNLGTINMFLGDFDKAVELKQESLNNHRTLDNKRGIANTLIDLASMYLKVMQPDSALAAAEEGLKVAAETNSWSVLQNAHQTLADIHEQQGNYEQALHHHKLFKAAHDSLFNSESQTVIAELQEQFRTRQQQQQIEMLQRMQKVQEEWFIMLSVGLVLVLIVLGLTYSRYKLKERGHKTREQLHQAEIEKARLEAVNIQSQTKLLEIEHKRKSKELDDARNLQLSMLPKELPENEFATIAAEMITAAEVGGDYYDVDISDDGELTFCIGDATGHGTRAGILVAAVKSLFNMMSKEKNLVDMMYRCSAAIKKMNLPILYMTFALARLKEDRLELIGAGMPNALIYRADSTNVECIELKGMPLGSALDFPYNLKTATLREGDVLVMMSDGFPELTDPKGRMMGYERAVELLKETGDLDPGAIIDYFQTTANEWSQSERPDDDMTFLVMKMKK